MKILTIAIIVLVSLTINKIGFKKIDSCTSEKTSVRMDAPLVGTQWTLVELSNTKIPTNAMSNGIFFILRKDSTVSGNGGCNTFTTRYALGKNNRIQFGEMVRTNVSCEAIAIEQKFINALASADHYHLTGDTLLLNRGASMNLAKFVAVR
jgi:heat shock protein HslJ